MANYHVECKLISRSETDAQPRSIVKMASYRAGEKLTDAAGNVHDYSRRARGVASAEIVMPAGSTWQPTRTELWGAVERKNKRLDAHLGRELILAVPHELDDEQRKLLVREFAQHVADRYQIGVDAALHHAPRAGDQRNVHAHLLLTANVINGSKLGNKQRSLDVVAHERNKLTRGTPNEVDHIRAAWQVVANAALERAGSAERIDHRTLEAQGIDRMPSEHLGPAVVNEERRTGTPSEVRLNREREQAQDAERRAELKRRAAEEAARKVAEADRLAREAIEAEWAQRQEPERRPQPRPQRRQEPTQPAPAPAPTSAQLVERQAALKRRATRVTSLQSANAFAMSQALPRHEIQEAERTRRALAVEVRTARTELASLQKRRAEVPWWAFWRRPGLATQIEQAASRVASIEARGQEAHDTAQRPVREVVNQEAQLLRQEAARIERQSVEVKRQLDELSRPRGVAWHLQEGERLREARLAEVDRQIARPRLN